MVLAIEKEYLLSIIPGLVKGFKENAFAASEKLEADYEAKLEVQARGGSASGRDTFPVVVDIYGAIVKHTSYDYIGTQSYGRYLRQLDAHPSVSAIILDINSGGGMISGTAELAHIIKGIEKPIIAYTNGYMCSAAYWIAAACDKVVSSPFADAIGSIGTMLHAQDYSQMFEKWGAKIYEMYAPESSEKNKLWRDLVAGDDTLAKERLSELAKGFISAVQTYRADIKDDGRVFKGAVYTPKGALEVGLVDEIMSLETLISEI